MDLSILAMEGLHALKDGLTVVQSGGSDMHCDVWVAHKLPRAPGAILPHTLHIAIHIFVLKSKIAPIQRSFGLQVRYQVRSESGERKEGRREGRKGTKSIVSAPLEVSISKVEVGKLMVGLVITGEVLWGLEVKSRKGRAAGSLLVGNDTDLAPVQEELK